MFFLNERFVRIYEETIPWWTKLYVAHAGCVIPFKLTFFYYLGQLVFEKLTSYIPTLSSLTLI